MAASSLNYELNRALFTVAREHRHVERMSAEDLRAFRLSPEAVAALVAGDTTALYRLGANPYLIRRVFRARFAN